MIKPLVKEEADNVTIRMEQKLIDGMDQLVKFLGGDTTRAYVISELVRQELEKCRKDSDFMAFVNQNGSATQNQNGKRKPGKEKVDRLEA